MNALKWSLLAVLVSAALTLLACGAPAPQAAAGATPDGATHSPAGAASGCGTSVTPGSATLTSPDGLEHPRTYVVDVPAGYAPARPYPVVFVFHGSGGNAAQSAQWGLRDAPGAAGTAIFVYPNGVNFQTFGVGWDDRSNGYDLPLFDHMLKAVEAGYCVDPKRVFVAGFSWGGDFAIALACNRGAALAAIAVNSSTDEFKDKANFMTYQDLPCPATPHPPVLFVHAVDGDQEYPPPYFATTSKLLSYLNGCKAMPAPVRRPDSPLSCATSTGCATDYVECSFDHGLGHTLPDHWAADTWAFFTAHGLAGT